MSDLVPIGTFSTACKITVKTLRRYAELGILKPAVVDHFTGYRYYSPAQVAEATKIRRLRALDMPLDEIRNLLKQTDPEKALELLEQHRERLEAKMREFRLSMETLREMLTDKEGIMSYEIEVKHVESMQILGHRMKTSLATIAEDFDRGYKAVKAYQQRVDAYCPGVPFAVYYDNEHKVEDIDAEVCVPVERPLAGTHDVSARTLQGGLMASTIHRGPYSMLDQAYGAVLEWVKERNYEPCGPAREVYLVGPQNADDPADFRTEIQWEVRPKD